MSNDAPEFTKTATGYAVEATMRSGRKVRIRVARASWANATARGGVTSEGWQAKFGEHKGYGKTRAEAVDALVRLAAAHGTTLTVA